MKCPKCGGNAELSNWGSLFDPDYADFHVECEKCGYHSMGSTDPQKAKEMFEKEMGMHYTNEQWFCLLSTEEKAEWLTNSGFLTCTLRDCEDCKYYDKNSDDCIDGYEATHDTQMWVEWLKQKHTNE